MVDYTDDDRKFLQAERNRQEKFKNKCKSKPTKGASDEPMIKIHRFVKPKGKQPKTPRPPKCSDPRAYDHKLPKTFRSYLMRANAKRLKFELDVDQFESLVNSSCVYCGVSPAKGIDRKESGDGYTIDNCAPCCFRCNIMKYTFDIEDFIKQVKRIHKHLNLNAANV